MPTMKQLVPTLLVLVLLVATAWGAVLHGLSTKGWGGDIANGFPYLDPLWFCCSGLLILWACLGDVPIGIRVATAVCCFAVLFLIVMFFGEWPGYWGALQKTAIQVSGVFLIFLLLRIRGIRAQIVRVQNHKEDTKSLASGLRWSVRDLLLWIAATAALLAVLRNLKPAWTPRWLLLMQILEGIEYSILAIAAGWFSLGRARTTFRLFGYLGVVAFLAVADDFGWRVFIRIWYSRPEIPWWSTQLVSAKWMGLQGLLIAASLWVFRLCGYRLLCQDRGAGKQNVESNEAGPGIHDPSA